MLIFPALYISRYESHSISVWMPRSRRSDRAIIWPTALGRDPMPSCRVEPSTMFCTTYSAIFISVSLAAGVLMPGRGPWGPSTIMSTSSMWMHSSRPP